MLLKRIHITEFLNLESAHKQHWQTIFQIDHFGLNVDPILINTISNSCRNSVFRIYNYCTNTVQSLYNRSHTSGVAYQKPHPSDGSLIQDSRVGGHQGMMQHEFERSW